MIDANRALILKVCFVAQIEVVVGVRGTHRHCHIGLRYVLQQERFEKRIDSVRRYLVVGKLAARVGKIGSVCW